MCIFYQNIKYILHTYSKFLADIKHVRKSDKFNTLKVDVKLHIKVINVGSDTFGNPIFQKGSQN